MYLCVLVLSKKQIVIACERILQQKLEELNNALSIVNEAANNETKSTAGDKHETAKAMMQLEQEKLGHQIKLINAQINELTKIDVTKTHIKVSNGSLILTNNGLLFIGLGLGKISVYQETIFTISLQSPLAKLLLNKKVGETVKLNNLNYTIENLG